MVNPPLGEIPILPEATFDYVPAEAPQYVNNSQAVRQVDNDAATLGRVIFYDKRLSKNGKISCASCHKQKHSFADDKQFSLGIDNIPSFRNAPNLNDLGWSETSSLFWDLGESKLHEMVLVPILNTDEMAGEFENVIDKLENTSFYPDLFYEAFGNSTISETKIGTALAHFINAMSTFNSKYDQVLQGYEEFSAAELSGKKLFNDNCRFCHSMNSFSSTNHVTVRNNALDSNFDADRGMGTWAGVENDGFFRSPSLRNVALSAPYMHDGRFATLEKVMQFYNEELQDTPNSFAINPPYYQQGGLNESGYHFTVTETSDIIAFLHTLTDETFTTDEKFSNPFPNQTVRTETLPNLENIKAYPIPSNNHVTIYYPTQSAEIILYDFHGRVIKRMESHGGEEVIYKNDLAPGMYGISILSENKQGNLKIIFN